MTQDEVLPEHLAKAEHREEMKALYARVERVEEKLRQARASVSQDAILEKTGRWALTPGASR